MNIKITGKELKATESIKNYIETKAERLQKYFDTEEIDLYLTIKKEGEDQVAEIQISVNGNSFRAVTASRDLYASIDKDIDILEGQIRKNKTKKANQNKMESIRVKEANREEHSIEDEIIKTIYYSIKPMGPEDAKLLLEEQPKNQFLTFINIETGKVNVIYRLQDSKNFGLLEPEE